MARTIPQTSTISVRETYEKHLRLMEENKAICDEIIAEVTAKVARDITDHPPTLDITEEIMTERELTENREFQRHSGKYKFHQARVNTMSNILMLAQNQKIIALLQQIAAMPR